jgi:hypothetical protein
MKWNCKVTCLECGNYKMHYDDIPPADTELSCISWEGYDTKKSEEPCTVCDKGTLFNTKLFPAGCLPVDSGEPQ